MPGTRRPYPREFRQQMVELYRAGHSPSQLAAEFEPSEETIRNWIAQAARRQLALTTGALRPESW